MTTPNLKFSLTCLILLGCWTAVHAADETFPEPAALARDVDFWISIFTDYAETEGALHDNRNLAVVYERMPLPEKVSRKERNRRVQRRRKHYQAVLRTLASGKRDNLTAEQQRVLDLWPADVSNGELQAAVSRIRFQQGLSERFAAGLRRAGRWRDHVHREFKKHGVPIELAALPHVESSYNPSARSHVGASGIWQFTRSTGRRFMRVDHVLDERNDPFLATTAAAKLLAYNYSITNNWPMAITAYNHGLAGAKRAMRQLGDTEYVKILRQYRGRTFGFASRNFYVAFLAAKHVDQNPEKYFPGLVPDKPIDYSLHTTRDFLPIDDVADVLGVTTRELAESNPALQATIFQGSKYLPRDYTLRMPSRKLNTSITESLAGLGADRRFAKQLPDLYHRVARGDTLSEIADEYGTRVSTLVALNNLGSRHRIRIGQRIRLPAAGPAPQVVAATEPEPQTASAEPPVVVAEVSPIVAPAEDVSEEGDEAVAEAPAATVATLVDDIAATVTGTVQSALLSDPSDYSVAEDRSIEVHPLETLGHYADWLQIKTQRLRDINGLAFRTPVEVGQRITLDLSRVEAAAFENLRVDYHKRQQDLFFRTHTISGIKEHVVGRGESVWILSLRRYGVPIWLFRQYNPELSLHDVRPGTRINFPVLVDNSEG